MSGTPDEVWQRFLMDSEDVIRASSAPREPSARDRAPGWRPSPPAVGGVTEAVGELWLPDDTDDEPAWRELDGRGRFRRVARVFATAAAVALALTVWSQLTVGPDASSGGPDGTLVERVEEAPAPASGSPSVPTAVTATATATS